MSSSCRKSYVTGTGLFFFYLPLVGFAVSVIMLNTVFDLPENEVPCNGYESRFYPCNLCCWRKDSCEDDNT